MLDETDEILLLDEEKEEISDEEGEGDENGTSGEDGDVLFVDASRTKKRKSAAANTSLEEGEIVDESEEEQQKMGEANAANAGEAPPSSSATVSREPCPAPLLKMQLGTPVPTDYAVEKPALEKWSIGIQAFQHQPPATSTGFFKRMHQIVKSVRKNPHAIGGGESDDKNEQKTDEQKR